MTYLIALAAATAAPQPIAEAAYFGGRCLRFISTPDQQRMERTITEGGVYLIAVYMRGLADEVREPTAYAVCKIAVDDVISRIKQTH